MSHVLTACTLTAFLAACAAQPTAITASARESSACAAIGIDPGSAAFSQCVVGLDQSLWDEQKLDR